MTTRLRRPTQSRLTTPNDWALALALLAAAMSVFSRVLVSLGAPGLLNFVHFPLAVLAIALLQRPRGHPVDRALIFFWVFSAFVLLSGAINGVGPMRIILTWLVWVEPLLVAYVVWTAADPLNESRAHLRRRAAFWVIAVSIGAQYVFMTTQIPRRSFGPDEMQGTFLGSGTGAHVAPALVLVGSILLLGSALDRSHRRVTKLALAVYGLLLAFLGAARAVSVTALVAVAAAALIVFLFMDGSKRDLWIAAVVAISGVLLISLGSPLFGRVPSTNNLVSGFDTKLIGVERILEHMTQDPASFVVGQGPGTTLSRVALETPGAKLNPNSAVAILDLETTQFTAEVVQLTGAAGTRSSLYAPWASLVGLVGDIGILGLGLYLALWTTLIRQALRRGRHDRVTLLSVVLLAALLGPQQIYWEDPGFILPVAAVLALGAVSTRLDPEYE